jgi:quinol monooxygenase YgiN
MASIAERRRAAGQPAWSWPGGTAAVTSLARFQAREGTGEELGRCLCELQALARGDAACLGCELLRESAGDTWRLRGYWTSEQALEAHLRLPHLQLLGRLVSDGLVRHMEMRVERYSTALAS